MKTMPPSISESRSLNQEHKKSLAVGPVPFLVICLFLLFQAQTQAADAQQQKQIPVVTMPDMETWLERYKPQGWAKCRMSAIDTFSLTQGKASTEIFVAIRHINDKMDELEDYLEKSGISAQKLDEMRREEMRLLSYMTLEQKSLLFKECALSVWE
jgi:hypothetical protein